MASKIYTYTGVVIHKGRVEIVGQKKKYEKQILVVSDQNDSVMQEVPFTFFGNSKVALLREIEEDDKVSIDFVVKGREWNKRWFPDLNAVDINYVEEPAVTAAKGKGEQQGFHYLDDDDDIPF